jgi:Uma2 family endonuclease
VSVETLVAPENEIFPHRRRRTVEQCYRLVDSGELTDRWELIDGEVISKSGQKPLHRFTLIVVAEWLASVFGFRRCCTQLPIRIPGDSGEFNEPEPDIAVVTEQATTFHDRIPGAEDVLLAVEISDTTLPFDLRTKALLYARSGIGEYWVVDIANRQIHRHRLPSHAGYAELVALGEEDMIAPACSGTTAVRIGDLLPPRTE